MLARVHTLISAPFDEARIRRIRIVDGRGPRLLRQLRRRALWRWRLMRVEARRRRRHRPRLRAMLKAQRDRARLLSRLARDRERGALGC